ncbi:glutamine amidotransferase, partial [Pantoea agglomerans]|nr:glutamine amidotransferase [Pantoea agglomerans]
DLGRAGEYRFVHTPAQLRAHDYREMNQALFTFLDKLAGRYNQSRQ